MPPIDFRDWAAIGPLYSQAVSVAGQPFLAPRVSTSPRFDRIRVSSIQSTQYLGDRTRFVREGDFACEPGKPHGPHLGAVNPVSVSGPGSAAAGRTCELRSGERDQARRDRIQAPGQGPYEKGRGARHVADQVRGQVS